ncbi:serine/threonine-protein kinase [Nonomuraea sediminis]|uniref:serine/threonine-protein kinase n=1 Tax=Nonomuraea sediminis TaxID=2835864 RepID=UPI001BDDBB4F|nr:serine/threonine-protein kinase [Nonomuraea sediminis]
MGQQGRSAGSPLTPDDPPGIGQYELVSRLGSGGMGTVYLARAADGAKVAVKAIRRDFTADPVYRARFLEEVSNARKVASFCTARVLDHGEDAGRLFLVTEYIDGISLEDQLIEHGPLPHSVLHSMAVGVAAALTAIHAAGLVHRDLKPANVMLTLAGPRVIDFGLARSTHVSGGHTNAGMVMGTPGWIAPEQVFEGRTSPAGDVFAWGSLVAYAGLGGHPFGEGDAYVMAARARTAPPDLRGLPAPLDRLVAAAIHPDPARRPPAKQLLLELVGAADEPAAQLAATRHLTNSWNPAAFPPLNTQVRPAAPPPHPNQTAKGPLPPPPNQAPQGPPPPPNQAPQGPPPPPSQTVKGPVPPPSGQTGQGPLPPPPSRTVQGPPPPQHPNQTGQGPLPLPGGHTGRVPLPPFTPPRQKRSVLGGCMTALVIVVVLLLLLVALVIWTFRPPEVSATGPVQDGKLTFTVTGTNCLKPAKQATQRSCRIALKVGNGGIEGRVLYPGQQKLRDEDDGQYAATKLLDRNGTEITPIRIGPGESFVGALQFDLPKTAKPASVELHDSALSTGAQVKLD